MYIIAGLGNPTKQYEGTRHNVGFDVIDRIADEYNISVETRKGKALTGTGIIAGRKVLLAKPQTYMNLSGESLRALTDFYKIDVETELLVIYDDISSGSVRKEVPEVITESKALSAIWVRMYFQGSK